MDAVLSNPSLRLFGIIYLILVLKMFAVGVATSFYRIRDKSYATPEDYRLQGLAPATTVNENVERARRAHRNDLENILPFFGVGLFYALTAPSPTLARIYFIGYAAARVLHTVFYLMELQPYRTIAFGVAALLMLAMLVSAFAALV
ncbi:MAG: MAPEG family protein [Candidatus Binatia bacterium]